MTRSRANGLLLFAALIWGTTFVAQQLGMQDMGPFFYTGSRFLLGALVILPLAWRELASLQERNVRFDRKDYLSWVFLGLLLYGGISLQQVGLGDTTVTNAGFFTSLYVPMVPLLAWVLHRQAPHLSTWPAVAGCLVGTYLLSGGRFSALTMGDLMIIGSTAFWGVHVLYVGTIAGRRGAPVLVSMAQFVFCGVLSLITAAFAEPMSWSALEAGLPAVLYGGVLSVGIGYTLQVVAQSHTRPADAAVLLSAETVFAGLAGAAILGERINQLQTLGCVLIFASIIGVQLAPMLRKPVTA